MDKENVIEHNDKFIAAVKDLIELLPAANEAALTAGRPGAPDPLPILKQIEGQIDTLSSLRSQDDPDITRIGFDIYAGRPEERLEEIVLAASVLAERLGMTGDLARKLSGQSLQSPDLTALTVPAPPSGSGKGSRKRPCAKNNNRRRERREGSADGEQARPPRQRKLNQYYLDVARGCAVAVRPGVEVPKGSRVIEQPPGCPAPGVAHFFDASLLPAGSTVIPHYGFTSLDLDASLVARLGRLSALAEVGRQARKTNLDVLGRSTDPTASLRAAIVSLGGPSALDCDFKDLALLEGIDRDAVSRVVAASVNVGNESATSFSGGPPARLVPSKRLVEHLSELPGRIVALESSGTGSRIEVRCFAHSDMEKIAHTLREAGGRRVAVRNTKIAPDDARRPRRAFLVSGEFAVSAAELAAARTGSSARLVYVVDDSGRAAARYETQLFDRTVTTPTIPVDPTRESVTTLLKSLSGRSIPVDDLLMQVSGMATDTTDPLAALIDFVGPVRSVSDLEKTLDGVTVDDVLGGGSLSNWLDRPRALELPGKREVPLLFREGAAMLLEEAYHVTDQRILELPDTIEGPNGPVTTLVREVVFSDGRGRLPRVRVNEVPVAEIKRRREAFFAKQDPEKALLTEIKENLVSEVARTMGMALSEGRPDGSAKSRARNKHVEHVLVEGGAMVALVAALAADPATGESGETWTRWCAQHVSRYRNHRAAQRAEGVKDAPAFFSVFKGMQTALAVQTVEAAAQSFLSMRLGREVTLEETRATAEKVRSAAESAAFTGFDRGRAVYHADHNGVSII